MNRVLISDPFLFPPSGEDTHPFGGTYQERDQLRREREAKAFIEYTKRQFDIAWESAQDGRSNLFDQPFNTNIHLYIPDSPDSILTDDDEMNADQFLGSNAIFSEGDMSFRINPDEVIPTVDELSCSLDVSAPQEPYLDSPQLCEWDGEDFYAILNGKTPETSVVAPNICPNESNSDQSLQESSVSLTPVSPGMFGIDIPNKLEPLSTIDKEVIVKITHIDPPNYEEAVQGFRPKRRGGRKTSLTTRQCSESPQYDFATSNIKTEPVSPDTTQDIKPVVGTKRTRKNSVHSMGTDANLSADNKSKRQKKYELDDPSAKNAKAAYLNRQKKKEKMAHLTQENQQLNNKLQEQQNALLQSQLRESDLKSKLEEHQRKTQAATGLNRILHSAKELLETVMVPLHQKYGPWNLQVAPWFHQVEAAMALRGEIPASMGGSELTSKFITLHFNPEDRVAMVDYRPDVPVLPKSMPQ